MRLEPTIRRERPYGRERSVGSWKLRHDLMTVVQRSFNSNKKKTNERWPRLGHDIVLEIVAVDWTVNSVHCPRVVSRNVAIDGPLDIGHTTPSNLDGYCLSMSG